MTDASAIPSRSGAQTDDEPESRTLSAEVFHRLREDLLAGRFKPNERLRLEELRQLYAVGFSPLREALMQLASDGLVVAEHRRGFRAAPISLGDLWDVTNTRQAVEELALKDSLEHGDDAWEGEIVAAFHRLSKVHHLDPETGLIDPEWARRHHAFHYALVAGAKSRWIKRFWQILYDQSDRYRRIAASFIPAGRRNEHRDLMLAALDRDIARLTKLNAEHIGRTAAIVAEHLPDSGQAAPSGLRRSVIGSP